jgi:single-stranded DNA-binding protein
VFALITGEMFRKAENRTSTKNGREFATATVIDRDGGNGTAPFVSIIAFAEDARAELARRDAGDHVAIQGPATGEEYEAKDGSRKFRIKIVANKVLALRQPPKQRTDAPNPHKAKPASSAREAAARSWQAPSGFSDDIPF